MFSAIHISVSGGTYFSFRRYIFQFPAVHISVSGSTYFSLRRTIFQFPAVHISVSGGTYFSFRLYIFQSPAVHISVSGCTYFNFRRNIFQILSKSVGRVITQVHVLILPRATLSCPVLRFPLNYTEFRKSTQQSTWSCLKNINWVNSSTHRLQGKMR